MPSVEFTIPDPSDLLFRMFFGYWVVYRSRETGRVQVRLNSREVMQAWSGAELRTFDTHEHALRFAHEVAA